MELKIELKRFLKNNIKLFLIITTSVMVIIYTFFLITGLFNSNSNNDEDIEDSKDVYTHQFDFYVEKADGNLFNNPSIIFENIVMGNYHEEIENEINVSLTIETEIPEDEESETSKDEEIEYKFEVNRDHNSGRYTFVVSLSELEDSYNAINEFHQLIEYKEIGVLEDKLVVIFSNPYLVEEDEINTSFTENQFINLRYIIISVIISVFVGIMVIIVKDLFSKTINYYFSYDADKLDHFILIDSKLENENYLNSLVNLNKKQLFMSSSNIDNNEYLNSVDTVSEIHDINKLESFDEVIIFVIPFQTTKQWYKKQKEFLSWDNKPVKVIQVNNLER